MSTPPPPAATFSQAETEPLPTQQTTPSPAPRQTSEALPSTTALLPQPTPSTPAHSIWPWPRCLEAQQLPDGCYCEHCHIPDSTTPVLVVPRFPSELPTQPHPTPAPSSSQETDLLMLMAQHAAEYSDASQQQPGE